MSDAGVFLLLLLAVLCGYVMGIYQRRNAQADPEAGDSGQAAGLIQSLNHLLRDESDQGLDQFIQRLDVTPATLETHLAVGSLLRRKGEVGRAIRVHQNLIARPSLGPADQRQAQLELARDFAHAGLLDRAERLLLELRRAAVDDKETLAGLLIEIYQDEKEWQKAADMVADFGSGWFGRLSDEHATLQAHFICELAVESLAQGDLIRARKLLRRAHGQSKQMPRTALLLAELELKVANHREALRLLAGFEAAEQEYLLPAVPQLRELARQETGRAGVLALLDKAHADTGIATFLLEWLALSAADLGHASQRRLLADAMAKAPNWRLLCGYLRTLSPHDATAISDLRQPLEQFERRCAQLPSYRCAKCGFAGRQLHWLCPGCKTWGNLHPIRGLEGV